MTATSIYYLHALSPLHVGTGVAVSAIKLPHSREASTGLPNAPGSALKGVLRDELRKATFNGMNGVAKPHEHLFGGDPADNQNRDQGALLFSDALLLCLAVPSYAGGFAWVTSPTALRRFNRERRAAGKSPLTVPDLGGQTDAAAISGQPLVVDGAIYLHDIRLEVRDVAQKKSLEAAQTIAAELLDEEHRQPFIDRFVVAQDAVLDYLAQAAMDVRTRIRLRDDAKVVVEGQLWAEENLPAESVLWGSVTADTLTSRDDVLVKREDALAAFRNACGRDRRLQLGGKASVGRGVVCMVLP